jgi:hypothetical protein
MPSSGVHAVAIAAIAKELLRLAHPLSSRQIRWMYLSRVKEFSFHPRFCPLFVQGLRYTNQADFSSQIHATLKLGFRVLLVKLGYRVCK